MTYKISVFCKTNKACTRFDFDPVCVYLSARYERYRSCNRFVAKVYPRDFQFIRNVNREDGLLDRKGYRSYFVFT